VFGEAQGLVVAALAHDAKRRPVIAGCNLIEIIDCPIKMTDSRPIKCPQRLLMRDTLSQQSVAQFDECFAALHGNLTKIRSRRSILPEAAPAHPLHH
jgi:hypothetical protein